MSAYCSFSYFKIIGKIIFIIILYYIIKYACPLPNNSFPNTLTLTREERMRMTNIFQSPFKLWSI